MTYNPDTIPSIEDMVNMFTWREMLELSNLDDTQATVINDARVNAAIADATRWFVNQVASAPAGAQHSLVFSAKRSIAIAARYLLDTYRTREFIYRDFEALSKQIQMTYDMHKYSRGYSSVRFGGQRRKSRNTVTGTTLMDEAYGYLGITGDFYPQFSSENIRSTDNITPDNPNVILPPMDL